MVVTGRQRTYCSASLTSMALMAAVFSMPSKGGRLFGMWVESIGSGWEVDGV